MASVELKKLGHTVLLTLNRSEVLNTLNLDFVREIHAALDEIEKDNDLYVLVITGTGKAFIAGADIHEWSTLTAPEAVVWSGMLQALTSRLEQFRLPVIAAVNGYALGGGCELAISCDFRIASQQAKFGQPEVGLGVMTGAGGTQRLPRLVGVSKAKELLFTGKTISADDALAIGLVDRVVAPEELLPVAFALADEISANGQIAVQQTKRAVNQGLQTDLATGLAFEAQAFAVTLETEDKNIGVEAFLSKSKEKNFVNF